MISRPAPLPKEMFGRPLAMAANAMLMHGSMDPFSVFRGFVGLDGEWGWKKAANNPTRFLLHHNKVGGYCANFRSEQNCSDKRLAR